MNPNDSFAPLDRDTIARLAWTAYDIAQMNGSLGNLADALKRGSRFRASCADGMRKIRTIRRALRALTRLTDDVAAEALEVAKSTGGLPDWSIP